MQINTQQKWLAIIEQQAQSALTVKQFCTQINISPSTFYQRKRELLTFAQQDCAFIKASVTQTVEVEAQSPPIRLTVGKVDLTLSSQTSPRYLASLINELHL